MRHEIHAISHRRHETRISEMINCNELVLGDRLIYIMYGRVLQRTIHTVYATNELVDVLREGLCGTRTPLRVDSRVIMTTTSWHRVDAIAATMSR